MQLDPRRATGARGEELAAAHLERLGMCVLARNARTAAGEIDIVAHAAGALVFVEVKTLIAQRGASPRGERCEPLAGLRPRQCVRVRHAAVAWLGETAGSRPRAHTLRFDAIGVVLDRDGRLLRLDHVEDAW